MFEVVLAQLKERGLVKAQGRQRTDATHVLGAIRAMNRVMCVAETLRAALNDLAEVAPEWLRSFAPDEWYEFYGRRIEETRFPKDETKRMALVETIGADGYMLLNAIYTTPGLSWLAHLSTVEILRRVWVQQFEVVEGQPHFRSDEKIPPSAKCCVLPTILMPPMDAKSPPGGSGTKSI
ncbi:MAG: hypothetical protein J2P37_24885 [Ktedonobacteraceae bacterium]|nr:hypothetical protein [Ktedonobacteraceae bacterium]MBO0790638.1 hypothetical protein [Ktedonobacteraceae bacterium]